MIIPPNYVAIALTSERGSRAFHEALAALDPSDGGAGIVRVARAITRTHREIPDDERAAWARTYLLRTEWEGEIPQYPAPGIRVWLPEEDGPVQTHGEARREAMLVRVPELQQFLAHLGDWGGPEEEGQEEPEPEPEPEPEVELEQVPEPEAAEVVAEAAPEAVEQEEPEPENDPGQAPRPQTTTTGRMPLLDDLTVEVATGRDGWRTLVTRNGAVVCDDVSRIEPWVDRRAVGRLTAAIRAAVPLDQRAIRDALNQMFAQFRESPDGAAITPEPVARVINATVRVTVEMSDPPVYVVDLAEGNRLIFKNRDLATLLPANLNDRWLAAHPRTPLDANVREFKAIRDYWLSIAEQGVAATGSKWDVVVDILQRRIAPIPAGTDREGLLRVGLFTEVRPDGSRVLWVASSLIESVLRDHQLSIMDRTFPDYLEREGLLIGRSRRWRVGGMLPFAWGFVPEFQPVDATLGTFGDLTAHTEGVDDL